MVRYRPVGDGSYAARNPTMRKNIRYYVYAVVALALLGMCFLLPGSSVFHQGAWLTVILGLLAPVVNRLGV